MPKIPTPPAIQMPAAPPPVPMFGMNQTPGADLRKKAQQDKSSAYSGSLLGSQLASANTGGKSLMGQTG